MAIKKITTPKVPEPPGRIYSHCLVVGKQIFLAGMAASAPDGGIVGGTDAYLQTRACMQRIKDMIEAAGGKMSDVVKMTVYLTDMSNRSDFARARAEFFTEPMPCSTLIEVKGLAHPGFLVEVDVTVVRGASSAQRPGRAALEG